MKLNTKLWRKLSILKGVGVYRSERLEWNSTLFFAVENEITQCQGNSMCLCNLCKFLRTGIWFISRLMFPTHTNDTFIVNKYSICLKIPVVLLILTFMSRLKEVCVGSMLWRLFIDKNNNIKCNLINSFFPEIER